jgi:formate dehydrogenase major subunit
MKLRRVAAGDRSPEKASWTGTLNPAVDRRKLLAAAGVGLGAAALAPSLVRQTKAAEGAQGGKVEMIKTICANCSVGCGFTGVVQDGVWVSQDPWFEHPINRGSMCSKGAAAREHSISEKRLRYPMKLEGGKWKRISWDTAMTEISAKLKEIRAKNGPDSLMILGSAHHTNEMCYALRKFSGFWGSNNVDHQARI